MQNEPYQTLRQSISTGRHRWGVVVKVFLSHSFSSEDRELVQAVERLLNSQDMVVTTGRRLAGGQLHPEIRNRIDNSDGLVALKTRRERRRAAR
jgi:hypothetical protein